MIQCRRCGQFRPDSEFIFVDVGLAEASVFADPPQHFSRRAKQHDARWRSHEAAMEAGCRSCRHGDYAAAGSW